MKKQILILLTLSLSMSSCTSYDSFNRTTTGMSLGGMFGSAIGGILGGPRGSDMGTLVGAAIGGIAGNASAQTNESRRQSRNNRYEEDYNDSYPQRNYHNESYNNNESVNYGRYNNESYRLNQSSQLSVSNITFADANGNRYLEAKENAQITFEIYNPSVTTVYNVAPIVACNNKHINISPTAIISEIPPRRGMRYTASVVAARNVRGGSTTFSIGFPDNAGNVQVVKTFTIQVAD